MRDKKKAVECGRHCTDLARPQGSWVSPRSPCGMEPLRHHCLPLLSSHHHSVPSLVHLPQPHLLAYLHLQCHSLVQLLKKTKIQNIITDYEDEQYVYAHSQSNFVVSFI